MATEAAPTKKPESQNKAASIVEFTRRRKYSKVIELFAQNPLSQDVDCWSLDIHGSTLLHQIVALRPPAGLVDLVITRMLACRPNSVPEDTTNARGMTPLHIAVAAACDIAVISRLTNGTVLISPALTMDRQHRLPLHWACTNPTGKKMPNSTFRKCGARSKEQDNMLLVIEKLVRVYPHAVWAKDKDGKTAYGLAHENKASSHVLTLLRITMESLHPDGYVCKNGSTEATSQFPGEVSEVSEYDCDDDVSSIGTGGVSTCHRKRSRRRRRSQVTQIAL